MACHPRWCSKQHITKQQAAAAAAAGAAAAARAWMRLPTLPPRPWLLLMSMSLSLPASSDPNRPPSSRPETRREAAPASATPLTCEDGVVQHGGGGGEGVTRWRG